MPVPGEKERQTLRRILSYPYRPVNAANGATDEQMTLAKHIEAAIIEGGWTVHASDFEGERLVIRCDGPKAESLVLWVLPAGAGEEP